MLQGQYLYLYKVKPKEKEGQVPIYVFNLKKSSVELIGEAYKLFTFKIIEHSRNMAVPEIVYAFGCKTKEERFQWIEIIRGNIDVLKADPSPILEDLVRNVTIVYKPEMGYSV